VQIRIYSDFTCKYPKIFKKIARINDNMKIMTVLGTRPEIIKLSPIIPLLDKEFDHLVVHTGQHYSIEMDDIFFKELGLNKPKYNLEVGSGAHGLQTGKMLERIEDILFKEKPDIMLVLGDTNTTLAGALAAAKMNVKLGHVEAGCRSFNRDMPEETNRIITDHISDYLFAPDDQSVANLKKEGIDKRKVFNVGSLAVDVILRNMKFAEKSNIMEKLGVKKGKYILVTVHRAENTDNLPVMRGIAGALEAISEEMQVVFAVHPRTEKLIKKNMINISKNTIMTAPLGYLEFIKLAANSRFIMSDSGGIQEEAAALNVPCIILRNETEWMRFVEAGKNILAGTKKDGIIKEAMTFLVNDKKLNEMKGNKCPLVRDVSENILQILRKV
jgi:UDP-N-acetylglucosamine 2-epimerase (non-hydrolysing)